LFPGNANYLKYLAIAKSKRDPDAAAQLWKRLAAGSEAGSELWFLSKLELAKNLATRDPDAAVRLLKQTMQLGGEMPEIWLKAYQRTINQLTNDESRQ